MSELALKRTRFVIIRRSIKMRLSGRETFWKSTLVRDVRDAFNALGCVFLPISHVSGERITEINHHTLISLSLRIFANASVNTSRFIWTAFAQRRNRVN